MDTYTHCPLCKQLPKLGLFDLDEYRFCPYCKLAWPKKFPKSVYGESYYQGTSTLISRLFTPIGKFFYVLRTWYVSKKNVSLWVDVGAGDGGFLEVVEAKRKIGVEVSKSGRKIMEEKGLATLSEKQFLHARTMHADVISFWHVLEHIENPWDYVKAAYKNLKKDGVIVIGIPNVESFELRMFKRFWFHLVPAHHLWFFSPRSINILLAQHNFKIQKIDFWSPEHQPVGILQSLINITSGSDSVLHRLVKRRESFSSLKLSDIVSSVFWLTIGMPIVFAFWVVNSLLHRSGTFVVTAKKR